MIYLLLLFMLRLFILNYIYCTVNKIKDWYLNWRPPKKSELTPKTAKAKVVRYAIIQSPQWFSALTHFSLEASNFFEVQYDSLKVIQIENMQVYLQLHKNYEIFLRFKNKTYRWIWIHLKNYIWSYIYLQAN